MAKIVVIGAGFSGLSAAAYLSAAGHQVGVFEKNEAAGGRARQLIADGFTFDMGPSWYWMPDVFNKFFNDFGYQVKELYDLRLLDPSFDIVFEGGQQMSIPADFTALCNLFESKEKGSAKKLVQFMNEAEYKYDTGMKQMVYMPGISVTEFADLNLLKGIMRLQVFSSFSKHIRKYFSHPHLLALMEFPVLFLGAMPADTPALYSLMNYAGLKLGTWYPQGGIGKVVEAMETVAVNAGAVFHYNAPVDRICIEDGQVTGIVINNEQVHCDAVIASSDYHHTEQDLLPPAYRNYSEAWWSKKTMAPSCLIFYVGLNKKIKSINHHTLFFEEELTQHAADIYTNPKWPSKPLFYVCCPSRTDETVAPPEHENLFFLMPLAPGLHDEEELRGKYFNVMLKRLEKYINEPVGDHIVYKKSYCVNDFISDYHAYKGNAYGLANTLMQTAILKPKIRNKKIDNLFYTGQLTVPGPGVPPSIISGKIAALQLLKYFKKKRHEVFV